MSDRPEFVFPATVGLTGQGLRLRQWTEADVPELPELFDDGEIAHWTPLASPFGPDDAREYVTRAIERAATGTRIQLAITTDGSRPLGEVGAFGVHTGPPGLSIELGYVVGRAHRGHRLAVRALSLLTEYALQELGAYRTVLNIERDNAASNAVARAAGYQLTPDQPLTREHRGRLAELHIWQRRAA
ncbi:GNAT family N-acetyltransferase [Streptomyces mayteni]